MSASMSVLTMLLLSGVTPPTATDAIKARDAEIRAALPASGKTLTPEVKKRVETILTRAVDLEGMAKAALGKHWEAQSKAKQREFLDVFRTAFRNAISGQTDYYKSSTTVFGPEEKDGERIKIPTTLTVKGEPTHVVYTMKQEGNDWRIVDITVDEVSTVENYRASFGRIITKEGFDGLIARLKKPPKK